MSTKTKAINFSRLNWADLFDAIGVAMSTALLGWLEVASRIINGVATEEWVKDNFEINPAILSEALFVQRCMNKSASFRNAVNNGEFSSLNSAAKKARELFPTGSKRGRPSMSAGQKLFNQYEKLSAKDKAQFRKLMGF